MGIITEKKHLTNQIMIPYNAKKQRRVNLYSLGRTSASI